MNATGLGSAGLVSEVASVVASVVVAASNSPSARSFAN